MNMRVRWTNHLPALALLLALAGVLWLGWPWPDPVADGFDALGRPIHWRWAPGSAEGAVMIWLVWFAFDGLWAAFERERRLFNPLSLVDEGLIAWILVRVSDFGVAHGMAPAVRVAAWVAGCLAFGAAVALELRRVTTPAPEPEIRKAEDVTELASELAALEPPGQRWSYWSVQKTPHRFLFGTLGAAFVLGAFAIPDGPLWARVLFLVGGVLTLTVCGGGLRTVVTPRRLVLRAGYLGPPLLRLATSEIAEVAVPDFDPLRDFGGWGIRRGLFGAFAGVWAFNFAASGVLVRTRQGKRYLIGTDQPERLAAALNAARGVRPLL
jgi:hypothetical protein